MPIRASRVGEGGVPLACVTDSVSMRSRSALLVCDHEFGRVGMEPSPRPVQPTPNHSRSLELGLAVGLTFGRHGAPFGPRTDAYVVRRTDSPACVPKWSRIEDMFQRLGSASGSGRLVTPGAAHPVTAART